MRGQSNNNGCRVRICMQVLNIYVLYRHENARDERTTS